MGKDSWVGIRKKVFPSLRRKIVIIPQKLEAPKGDNIYVSRGYRTIKNKDGRLGLEANILKISSSKEFILPEFAYLDKDIDLIREGLSTENTRQFTHWDKRGRFQT